MKNNLRSHLKETARNWNTIPLRIKALCWYYHDKQIAKVLMSKVGREQKYLDTCLHPPENTFALDLLTSCTASSTWEESESSALPNNPTHTNKQRPYQ